MLYFHSSLISVIYLTSFYNIISFLGLCWFMLLILSCPRNVYCHLSLFSWGVMVSSFWSWVKIWQMLWMSWASSSRTRSFSYSISSGSPSYLGVVNSGFVPWRTHIRYNYFVDLWDLLLYPFYESFGQKKPYINSLKTYRSILDTFSVYSKVLISSLIWFKKEMFFISGLNNNWLT